MLNNNVTSSEGCCLGFDGVTLGFYHTETLFFFYSNEAISIAVTTPHCDGFGPEMRTLCVAFHYYAF